MSCRAVPCCGVLCCAPRLLCRLLTSRPLWAASRTCSTRGAWRESCCVPRVRGRWGGVFQQGSAVGTNQAACAGGPGEGKGVIVGSMGVDEAFGYVRNESTCQLFRKSPEFSCMWDQGSIDILHALSLFHMQVCWRKPRSLQKRTVLQVPSQPACQQHQSQAATCPPASGTGAGQRFWSRFCLLLILSSRHHIIQAFHHPCVLLALVVVLCCGALLAAASLTHVH